MATGLGSCPHERAIALPFHEGETKFIAEAGEFPAMAAKDVVAETTVSERYAATIPSHQRGTRSSTTTQRAIVTGTL